MTEPTPGTWLAALPPDRRAALGTLRDTINAHLPEGYAEGIHFGALSWVVPLDVYPDTYNRRPLQLAALGSLKSHMALYLMAVYGDPELEAWFRERWTEGGRKLDMGRACVRFKRVEDVPLDLVGEVMARMPVDRYVARVRALREARRGAP
jgi:hypothetical protein